MSSQNLSGNQFSGVPIPEGTYIRRSGGIGHMPGDESRSITKMLPISLVKKYVEYDRAGKDSQGSHSEQRINDITNELKSGGVIQEPLMLEHSTKHQWGYLGEGHHRLLAAERAGLTHVPVFIYSSEGRKVESNKEQGIGAPLTLTTSFGNFPGDRYQPKEIHPDHFQELRG